MFVGEVEPDSVVGAGADVAVGWVWAGIEGLSPQPASKNTTNARARIGSKEAAELSRVVPDEKVGFITDLLSDLQPIGRSLYHFDNRGETLAHADAHGGEAVLAAATL